MQLSLITLLFLAFFQTWMHLLNSERVIKSESIFKYNWMYFAKTRIDIYNLKLLMYFEGSLKRGRHPPLDLVQQKIHVYNPNQHENYWNKKSLLQLASESETRTGETDHRILHFLFRVHKFFSLFFRYNFFKWTFFGVLKNAIIFSWGLSHYYLYMVVLRSGKK